MKINQELSGLLWDITKLKADPKNARQHDEINIEAIKGSLARFGQQKPVVIRADGTIVAGHGLVMAAQALGWAQVACVTTDLTDEKVIQAYALADNKTGELSDWNSKTLAQVLDEMKEDAELLRATGFKDYEIHSILDCRRSKPDDVPQVPKVAVSKPGEIYQLGPHRLMCGSSANEEDVARLMDGKKANMLSTDPPYFVDYDGTNRPGGGHNWSELYKEKGVKPAEAELFLCDVFATALQHTVDKCAVYCWHASKRVSMIERVFQFNKLLVHQTIIWVKPCTVPGFSVYDFQNEPCLLGWKEGFRPDYLGERKGVSNIWRADFDKTAETKPEDYFSDVWDVDFEGKKRQSSKSGHPTSKPVRLFEIPMAVHTRVGDLCYEPFCGSGSQIIAGEKMGRVVYGMELQPVFCDVIRDRYARFTGNKELAAHPELM